MLRIFDDNLLGKDERWNWHARTVYGGPGAGLPASGFQGQWCARPASAEKWIFISARRKSPRARAGRKLPSTGSMRRSPLRRAPSPGLGQQPDNTPPKQRAKAKRCGSFHKNTKNMTKNIKYFYLMIPVYRGNIVKIIAVITTLKKMCSPA